MKQFYCTGLGSTPYDLEGIQRVFPRSVEVVTGLGVGQSAMDSDGDTWFRAPDLAGGSVGEVEVPRVGANGDERLERVATSVFAAMINAAPMRSAHVLATTAVDFAKALIAELDKQA